ncbi:hypothetical protein INT44_003900 [Umbelopsis vinacea]|uniref:Transketolase n=1 Tax=Umbelopsis vinacea TaxID=44442 RepID=A0A8H7QCA4_9FUNG|nr:hypothetical protein INT44_003900 [Umbelopsis vinacea]KAI9286838.1 transketolase [Umbelopsis sp. AD052]
MSNIDALSINTIRALAADITFEANSGHPGAPMGCAPIAHVLWKDFIRCNPKNPNYPNRDRFVLSNGHACALQYSVLHLLGYDVTMDDLKHFRKLNSRTPGHPERGHTSGIEVTTGPLGQGITNAVGLAIAEANLAATFNKPGYEVFGNYTYALMGDGCMQEGISSEACSLAGHLQLGKLIVLYDDNKITIDGDTAFSFTEDVSKRYEAYGWHVQSVDDGDENTSGIKQAVEAAQKVTDKPSLIKVRTTIGFGSKNQGKESVHGSPLDVEDIKSAKKRFGFDPEKKFSVSQEVYDYWHKFTDKGVKAEKEWNDLVAKYQKEFPEEGAELKRRLDGKLPKDWSKDLPRYTPSDKPIATRKNSEATLTKLVEVLPELIGGSADLTPSNNTRWKGAVDFQPPSTGIGEYKGRYIRYGVREHAMFGIMNGIAAYQGLIPYGGTFLNFLTYGWGAARLAALSHLRTIFVMTHDSIGLGEDGPTHQPIETLAITRATPNMLTFRPADGNETTGTYICAIEYSDRPSVIALSRQNLPQLEGSAVEKVSKGAYVLQCPGKPDAIIVSTGSEVCIAVDAAKKLKEDGVNARIVSMPCSELFDEQPLSYKTEVFPTGVPIISLEALTTFGWQRYSHAQVGMTTFGVSAAYTGAYEFFNITAEHTAKVTKETIAKFKKVGHVPEISFTQI